MSRFLPLDSQIKNSMKRFNQLQKKHLMRFHYLLNPIALCIAFSHFLLSSCRSSPFPEWGLILVTMMVFLGLILKYKVSPKGMRKFVYRLHTAPATFLIMILLIVVGHQIVDRGKPSVKSAIIILVIGFLVFEFIEHVAIPLFWLLKTEIKDLITA